MIMRNKTTPHGVPDEAPDVPDCYEYEVGNSTYTVWSCAWIADKDDLSDARIDNLGNPYGSFKTVEEAQGYLMSIGPERDCDTGEEMTTLYVIERRTFVFCKFVEPGSPWRRPKNELIEH